MFKDTPQGTTHSYNDGCGEKEHNNLPDCPTCGYEPQNGHGLTCPKREPDMPYQPTTDKTEMTTADKLFEKFGKDYGWS